MIFNMTGSGGAPLNFEVVPNPQPDTAKENTIWVDTDRINNYYFSATQPEGMVDYDVWFLAGYSSSVEFNALKKNGIQVYPLSAMQMVSGALKDVTAKIYQGGKWADWITECYLYNEGDQCSDITGGWGKDGWTWAGYANSIQGLTINSDHIKLSANPPSYVAAVGTNKKVNLSRYKSLEVLYDMDKGSCCINITTSKAANTDSGACIASAEFFGTGYQTASISIEGVNMDAYICVFSNSLNTVVIHKVLLKP